MAEHLTPAALAAIEARLGTDYSKRIIFWTDENKWSAWTDLAALLAHIRTMEAEREEFLKLLVETKAAVDGMPKRIADGVQPLIKAEIAAAVARERERCAGIAQNWRDGNPQAVALCSWTAGRIAAAIREPKP